jgi:hypothetical protein
LVFAGLWVFGGGKYDLRAFTLRQDLSKAKKDYSITDGILDISNAKVRAGSESDGLQRKPDYGNPPPSFADA